MRKDKNKAIILRKEGESYNQISKALNIPKSTLSYWLREIVLSKSAQKKISQRVYRKSVVSLIKRNKNQTLLAKKRAQMIRNQAKLEVKKLMENKLFVVGISLYWAEGYKKGADGSKWKNVDFANSDPAMINIMLSFFRKVCGVADEKIKIQLIAHPNINIDKALMFWTKLTKIPPKQFIKTCYSVSKASKNKRKINSLTHGTVHIRINDVRLFFKIIGWIDGLKFYFH